MAEGATSFPQAIALAATRALTERLKTSSAWTGIDALLVGIGPGAACTTRGVLGIGVGSLLFLYRLKCE